MTFRHNRVERTSLQHEIHTQMVIMIICNRYCDIVYKRTGHGVSQQIGDLHVLEHDEIESVITSGSTT